MPVSPTAAPGTVGLPAHMTDLAVRTATALQLGPVTTARHAAHVAYVRLATGIQEVSRDSVSALQCALVDAWRLKWENGQKELLWRLTVDGVRNANTRTVLSWCCQCCPVIV